MASSSHNDMVDHVRGVWSSMKPKAPIYDLLLGNLDILSASQGVIQASLHLDDIHLNSKGTLNGAVSACLCDWAGSMAIASYGLEQTGVSTDLHVTYVSSAQQGDLLHVEGKASKVGSSLAFTTCAITKMVDSKPGPVVATGTHAKYMKQERAAKS